MKNSQKYKIAWISPYSKASSIGEFSHTLLESFYLSSELKKTHDITIFSNVNGKNYPSHFNIINLNSNNILEISSLINNHFDIVFFNFGNNIENHGLIFQLSSHCKGIGIYHDVVYQHYFANLFFEKYQSPVGYAYLMGEHYGYEGLKAVKSSNICSKRDVPLKFGLWDSDVSSKFPLINELVNNKNIIGTVVNSKYAFEFIKALNKPNLTLRLPGDEKYPLKSTVINKWKNETINKSIINISSFGHIQRAKNFDFILNTIANSQRLRSIVKYTIAGRPSDKEYINELEEMIVNEGLKDIVILKFNISTVELNELKEHSDFFINIRHPNTEGGSGSLIEQLAAGKPVIVLKSGCYSEVTDGTVFIDSLDDVDALENAIYRLATDSEYRVSLGDKAYSFANEFTSLQYIEKIIEYGANLFKNENSVKSSELRNITFNIDTDYLIKNPQPFLYWDDVNLSLFLEIILDLEYIPTEATTFLLSLKKQNTFEGLEVYNYIRSVNLAITNFSNEIGYERWRFPEKFNFNYFIFIACLENLDFIKYARVAVLEENLSEFDKKIELIFSRLHINSFLCRISVILSLTDVIPIDDVDKFSLNFKTKKISKLYFEYAKILRNVCKLTDSDFNDLVLQIGPQFFSTEKYSDSYPDTLQFMSTSEVGSEAFNHFKLYGINENRIPSINFDGLIFIYNNMVD